MSTGAQGVGERTKTLQIRNVLVPVDFSAPSLEAMKLAVPWVKRFGAQLHMIHAFEPNYSMASIQALDSLVSELEVGRRIRRQMKDLARTYAIEVPRGNMHYLKGRPFEEICGLARDDRMDLIVMATRGNTGFKHLALGSTAERVVRYSPCPVLVVRGATQQKTSGNGSAQRAVNLKRILVPIDFSDCSMKGLAYAKALAREFGSTLVLIHSVHFQYYVTNDEYARYDYPLLMQQIENVSRDQLRDLVEKTDWEGVKVESTLEIGHAGLQICDRAKDRGVDLIVTSTHGRTGLEHVLIGSTAEYVVRHAPCPVLVVPSNRRPAIKLATART